MRKSFVVPGVLTLAVLGCQGRGPTPEVPPPTPLPTPSVDITCGTAQNPIVVSSQVPHLPNFPQGSFDTIEGLQCDFDVFSWNSFIALSHAPDGSFGNGPTVWEAWPESTDIFLDGGADPGPWPARREVPSSCENAGDLPVFSQLGKRPDVLEASDEPFKSGPLVDTNGWYSRFSISVNRDMYDFIRQHQLYSQDGQKAFSDAGNTVDFPCGCDADDTGKKCSAEGQVGAVMVKASWKVLDPEKDDVASFHAIDALVVTPANEQTGQPETCTTRKMGLVGFHIGHKTQSDPQWVWSTFEHVRNVPTEGETIPAGATFNYYIPDCTDCNTVNEPPPQPWNAHDEPVTENAEKSQVTRVLPIDEATRSMNAKAQELLAGTVWVNYELISTQWPTNGNGAAGDATSGPLWCTPLNQVDKAGAPAPPFLGNSTLETYIQGTVPQASSSCINCHLNATMAVGQNNFSDFTYLLELAQ